MDETVRKTHWSPESLKMFDTERFSCRSDLDSMRHLIKAKIHERREGQQWPNQAAGRVPWSRWLAKIPTGVRIEEKIPKLNLGVQSVCCFEDPMHGDESNVRQGVYVNRLRRFAECSAFIQSEEESIVSECHQLVVEIIEALGAELLEEYLVPVDRRSEREIYFLWGRRGAGTHFFEASYPLALRL